MLGLLLVEFGVLGPITVWSDGQQIAVGGPRQRCVLGALLVHLGREVTVDQLIGYLWANDPPRTARSVIQVQISHLRRILAGSISTTPGGYTLVVDPDSVDLHRFRRLRDEAAKARPEEGLELLEQALGCWRGVPFSGIGSEHLDYSVVAPLVEERWSAVLSWATCALELGHNRGVVTRLTPLVSEEPFRERLHYLFITALWRDNERARALAEYEEFRSRLANELGVDPGPELVSLHTRILQEDLSKDPGRVPGGGSSTSPEFRYLVRNDLPRDLPDFIGRQESLRDLKEAAFGDDDRAKVCVITGSGGEGKTTTAVRFGYEAVKHFPDGQLFIDLYGYTSNKEPLDPSSALGALLRAVGISPEAVPDSLDERSALWRATLRDRKALLILDNAAGFSQVSPLLLPSPGSLTLITTRNDLSGLSGAKLLSLGMFDERSSLEFLEQILGAERVRSEPEQASEIVRVCGGLPLALRVVSGRMLSRPKWSLAHVAKRLNEQNRKLRELQVEGQSVESAIDLSFQSLSPSQRRIFLLLGLMIGNTIDLAGGAALLDMTVEDADDALQELVGMCLVDEPQGDVYRLHDLIRSFAQERTDLLLGEKEAVAAKGRLADYYLSTAQHAADLFGPRTRSGAEDEKYAAYRTELMVREDAESWFSLHQENLAEAIEYFASRDNGEHAWRLAETVWRFYALRGEMGLLVSSHERALQISDKQGNQHGRAVTLIGLGVAHYLSGNFSEALNLLSEAHGLLEDIGDRRGIIRSLGNLGMVYERVGRFRESDKAIQGVLDTAIELGDSRLEAFHWGNQAVLKQVLGEHTEAIRCAEKAIARASVEDQDEVRAHAKRVIGEARASLGHLELAFQDLNEAMELSHVLRLVGQRIYIHNSLGLAYRAARCWDEAVRHHTEAITLAEGAGDHSGDAEILTDLGATYAAAGRNEEAVAELERALEMAFSRNERYTQARAMLALGRLPAPSIAVGRARELLQMAERIFAELDLPEMEQAREALRNLGSNG